MFLWRIKKNIIWRPLLSEVMLEVFNQCLFGDHFTCFLSLGNMIHAMEKCVFRVPFLNQRKGENDHRKYFVEIDHEIFSMVILSLPLIQEGQLSFSGKRMCTILVNCLED